MASKNNKPVALVTGASSGMGKDFALRLIKEGYVVYGAARRLDQMQAIKDAGGRTFHLDVSDETSLSNCVGQIIAEQGRIDVLINNAGYGQFGAIEDVPMKEARRQFDVNLFGLARLTQLVLPHMRARKFGKIVNISSIGGKVHTPLGGWYHASKFALEGFSDVLRVEVRPFGIDVIVIEPGGIDTEWSGIATDEAVRLSGSTGYAKLVAGFRRVQANMTKAPGPEVISNLIVRALKARRPKTRYAGGLMAAPMLFLRRHLSDRMFDGIIMQALR